MTTIRNRPHHLFPLLGLLLACGDPGAAPEDVSGDTSSTSGTGSETLSGESSGTTDDPSATGEDESSGSETGGEPEVTCTPPPLLELAAIPDNPSLDPGNDDVVATFEVDGHDLIGKFVTDVAAAQGGLKLWQELTLRIPENQLLDLVQFDIYLDSDPVAYFNRTGNVTTSRMGLKIGFSVENFELNQADPCAPLEPRRGTFDWSLVHEFGHLRGFVDGSWPEFLGTFPDVQGDGEGYPEDGSPILTGDFVTSYAERDDGDEDYAESWTTYVMLPSTALPDPTEDEPLALQKVRWIDQQPGLRELREALRVTAFDALPADVPDAPRLDDSFPGGDSGGSSDEIDVPAVLHGAWRESPGDGLAVTFSQEDIVLSRYEGGAEVERLSLAEAQEAGELEFFERHLGASATLAYSFIQDAGGDRWNHDFFLQEGEETVQFARERLDIETNDLEYLEPVLLTRVP